MQNPHHGSSLEDFLSDEGILEEVTEAAHRKLRAARRHQVMLGIATWAACAVSVVTMICLIGMATIVILGAFEALGAIQ